MNKIIFSRGFHKFFLLTSCHTKVKEYSLPYYLHSGTENRVFTLFELWSPCLFPPPKKKTHYTSFLLEKEVKSWLNKLENLALQVPVLDKTVPLCSGDPFSDTKTGSCMVPCLSLRLYWCHKG